MTARAKKILFFSFSLFLVLGFFLLTLPSANAQTAPDLGLSYASATGLSTVDIRTIIARIIQVALGLLGLISVCLIIYGGWLWMTSGGEESKINEAKQVMINWAIGLAIILMAFAIVTFLLRILGVSMGQSYGPPGSQFGFGNGALGNGIIESHYPLRDAVNIPRNTQIIITFKEPMDVATIMQSSTITRIGNLITGKFNADNIKIFTNNDGIDQALISDAVVVRTIDEKTFVFRPLSPLGSSSQKLWYSVRLGENLKTKKGLNAFPSGPNGFYLWQFEVGTFIDITSPKVKNVFPPHDPTGEFPEYKNAVVQINFDEVIDPTTAVPGNIVVYQVAGATQTPVVGTLAVSNGYKTVEFLSTSLCGLNSCGEEVYCLPGNAQIKVVIKAATLAGTSPDQPGLAAAADGIADVAANSLNGNGIDAGTCETDGFDCSDQPEDEGIGHCNCAIGPGPATPEPGTVEPYWDNFVWLFSTTDEALLSAPIMESMYPGPTIIERSEVNLSSNVRSVFGRLMMGQTLNSTNINIGTNNLVIVTINGVDQELPEAGMFWFTVGFDNEDSDDDGRMDKAHIFVDHTPYQKTIDDNNPFDYSAQLTAGVRDIYQNCFKPSSGPSCLGNPSCCISDTSRPYGGICPRPLPVTWAPGCGSGYIDPGEACDDGNTVSGDGCSSTCEEE